MTEFEDEDVELMLSTSGAPPADWQPLITDDEANPEDVLDLDEASDG